METKLTRIYTFESGTKIDLRKVISIGALDKNINNGTFFINIHCSGLSTPIQMNVGFAIGKVEETKKTKILSIINDFHTAWENYIESKEKGGLNAN